MMTPKTKKIIYWSATVLLAIGMLQSGIFAIFQTKEWIDLVTGLGYPVYLLPLLGTWKILGVLVIVLPKLKLLKEWAYAGFFFAMSGALISHFAVGNLGIKAVAGPAFQILFIVLSWYYRPVDRKLVHVPAT